MSVKDQVRDIFGTDEVFASSYGEAIADINAFQDENGGIWFYDSLRFRYIQVTVTFDEYGNVKPTGKANTPTTDSSQTTVAVNDSGKGGGSFGLCDTSGPQRNDPYPFANAPEVGLIFDPTLGFYYASVVLILAPEPGTTLYGLLSLGHGLLTDLGLDGGQLDANLLPAGFYGDQVQKVQEAIDSGVEAAQPWVNYIYDDPIGFMHDLLGVPRTPIPRW